MIPELRVERQPVHDVRPGQTGRIISPCFDDAVGIVSVRFEEPAGVGGLLPIAGGDGESVQWRRGQISELRKRALTGALQRTEAADVQDEFLGANRATQQIAGGIEQWAPLGFEPEMSLLAVPFGLREPGIDQLIERSSYRHRRIVQRAGYEGGRGRGFVES